MSKCDMAVAVVVAVADATSETPGSLCAPAISATLDVATQPQFFAAPRCNVGLANGRCGDAVHTLTARVKASSLTSVCMPWVVFGSVGITD